jgi:hypothetical protein
MRRVLLPLAVLCMSFAPAPFPRRGQGPAVEAVLSLPPGDREKAAERAGSLAEVEAAFAQALWADEHCGKTPAWVHARLRVEVVLSGKALRLTLSGFKPKEQADLLALLDLVVQKHARDRISRRRVCLAAWRERLAVMKKRGGLREEDLRAAREDMREVREETRKEEDAIVLQQPAVRRR